MTASLSSLVHIVAAAANDQRLLKPKEAVVSEGTGSGTQVGRASNSGLTLIALRSGEDAYPGFALPTCEIRR